MSTGFPDGRRGGLALLIGLAASLIMISKPIGAGKPNFTGAAREAAATDVYVELALS